MTFAEEIDAALFLLNTARRDGQPSEVAQRIAKAVDAAVMADRRVMADGSHLSVRGFHAAALQVLRGEP